MSPEQAIEKSRELQKLWDEWLSTPDGAMVYEHCEDKTVACVFVVFCMTKKFTL